MHTNLKLISYAEKYFQHINTLEKNIMQVKLRKHLNKVITAISIVNGK